MKIITILPLVCALFLSSCASLISGKTQKVSFQSQPSGAKVAINGENVGVTPLEKELSRKTSHRVEITLAGYKPHVATVEQSTNGWVFGNILAGGLIGIIVDGCTGACYALTPTEVQAVFKPDALTAATTRGDTVLVATVLKPVNGWRKIAQMEKL